MFRAIAVGAFLAVASLIHAQTAVDFDDALATPEAYLHRTIVFHNVFVGDMFRMNIQAFGGDTFFLRIENDERYFVGGFADVFVPILPHSLACQWADLGLRSLDFRLSNVYGRFRQDGPWIIFDIDKVELLDSTAAVIEVIE